MTKNSTSQTLEYLSSGEFAKKVGVHTLTLKRWAELKVFMPAKVSVRGHKFYQESQINDAIKLKNKRTKKKTVQR